MAATTEEYDFIIVGGGIGGAVLASRLHDRDTSLSVLLIEAGPDSSITPLAEAVATPLQAPLLKGSELDYNYASEPQKYLSGARIYQGGGRALGGSSVINYGICFHLRIG